MAKLYDESVVLLNEIREAWYKEHWQDGPTISMAMDKLNDFVANYEQDKMVDAERHEHE